MPIDQIGHFYFGRNRTFLFWLDMAIICLTYKAVFVTPPPTKSKFLSKKNKAIEQCFEEAKSDLGMDHYEVRKFTGWRHHMLTRMLAYFFLWHMRIRLGEKSTSHYAVAA